MSKGMPSPALTEADVRRIIAEFVDECCTACDVDPNAGLVIDQIYFGAWLDEIIPDAKQTTQPGQEVFGNYGREPDMYITTRHDMFDPVEITSVVIKGATLQDKTKVSPAPEAHTEGQDGTESKDG